MSDLLYSSCFVLGRLITLELLNLQVVGNYITISIINFRDGQLRPPKTPTNNIDTWTKKRMKKKSKGRRRES